MDVVLSIFYSSLVLSNISPIEWSLSCCIHNSITDYILSPQIGSISLKCETEGISDMVVSQPGAAYVILKQDGS